jgi:thiamine kinase-like enzyme
LAKLHSLNVPIKKTNNDWYLSIVDICLKTAYDRYPIEELIDKNNLKILRNNSIAKELEWIKNKITDLKIPIVFCHNDFRGNNIMVKDKNITEYDRLLFCDLENCRYGYRGVDFASIFGQWDRELTDFHMYCESVENKSDPQEFTEYPNFPNDSTIELFISFYIEESVRIYGTEFFADEKNSLKSILAEVKIFSLLIKLFTVLAFLQQNEGIGDKEFDKLLTLVSKNLLISNYDY